MVFVLPKVAEQFLLLLLHHRVIRYLSRLRLGGVVRIPMTPHDKLLQRWWALGVTVILDNASLIPVISSVGLGRMKLKSQHLTFLQSHTCGRVPKVT